MSTWRFERKIPLGNGDLQHLENLLLSHPMGLVAAYPNRSVHNVYFDTPDMACYNAHLAGHEARAKWRLRAYDNAPWKQLEEKRKVGDHGDKRLYPAQAAVQALELQQGILLNESLMYPVLENKYLRRYFHAPAWGIRVTIDTEIQFTSPGSPSWQTDYDYVAVLEVKYALESAKIGQDFLRHLPWRLSRFSKYVRGVQLI